jgi:hypothetical protein
MQFKPIVVVPESSANVTEYIQRGCPNNCKLPCAMVVLLQGESLTPPRIGPVS